MIWPFLDQVSESNGLAREPKATPYCYRKLQNSFIHAGGKGTDGIKESLR
jgi:hypothetical protein